jgi:hypothetical protein
LVKKTIIFQFIILLLIVPLLSQNNKITIKTEVSSNSISIEETIIFKVIIRGKTIPSKISADSTLLKNFGIISKKSHIKNGYDLKTGKYRERHIIYTLKPKRSGELIISPFTIFYKSKIYKTYPITIYVSEKNIIKEKEQLFIKAISQKQSLFPKEQTLLKFELFTNMSISGISIKEPLSVSGLWVEEYPDTGTRKAELIKTGKNTLYKYTIKRYSIFPRNKGKIVIPSITFEITTASDITLYRKSNPLTLYVKSLDPSRIPDGYSGLVGNFSLSSSMDKFDVIKGTPVRLKITINGTGNIKALPTPKLKNIRNFRYFPPEVNIKIKYTDKEVIETKEWVFMLVPLRTGILSSPSYCIWYYIPSENRFRNSCTRIYKIFVRKETAENRKIIVSRKQLPPPEIDDYYLNNWTLGFFKKSETILLIIIFLPLFNLIIFLLVLIMKKQRKNKNKNIIKNSRKYIKKGIRKLSKLKKQEDFVTDTIMFIEKYISLLYGEENVLENFSSLKDFLIKHNFPLSLIDELIAIIKKLRASTYSPQKKASDRQPLLNELERVLIDLGKVKKK